jgi:CRISPR-associated protein Csx17
MLAALRAGDRGGRAVTLAARRLRSSGLTPTFRTPLPTLAGIDPARAAAALLIPLRWSATAALARALLDEPDVAAQDHAAADPALA